MAVFKVFVTILLLLLIITTAYGATSKEKIESIDVTAVAIMTITNLSAVFAIWF